MGNSKWKALIIGCGNQGAMNDVPGSENQNKIISFAHTLKENGNFIIDFYDVDTKKSMESANIWEGYSVKDITGHDYNIICITTPDETHYKILKDILRYKTNEFIENNLKLVICEKPLCTNLDQAREIVQLYKEKNVPIMMNYTRVYIPELQELKRKYNEGCFGKLLDYNLAYNRGSIHTGTHMIHFMDWFFDGKYSDGLHIKIMEHVPYRIWQIQLFFEKYFWEEKRIFEDNVPEYYNYHMKYVIENAYNFLEGKEELLCIGEDGLKVLEICYKLLGWK